MGHLMRSLSLIRDLSHHGITCHVFGPLDGQAFDVLERASIEYLAKPQSDVVVIDAVEVSAPYLEEIMRRSVRMLISPTFSDTAIATHILSRIPVPQTSQGGKSVQTLVYDPGFSFASVGNLQARQDIKFTNLTVGVCGSGSSNYIPLETVVSACLTSNNVRLVKELSTPSSRRHEISTRRHVVLPFTDQPWAFFHDIDVFITGDGIMLFEALAQNIPTVSIYRGNGWAKNSYFYENGFCLPMELSSVDEYALLQILEDKSLLAAQSSRLNEAEFLNCKHALCYAIVEIHHNAMRSR